MDGNAYVGAVGGSSGPARLAVRASPPEYIEILHMLYVPSTPINTNDIYTIHVNVTDIVNDGMNLTLSGISSISNKTIYEVYNQLTNETFYTGTTQSGGVSIRDIFIPIGSEPGVFAHDITEYIRSLQNNGISDVYTPLRLTGTSLIGCDVDDISCETTGYVISEIHVEQQTQFIDDSNGLSAGAIVGISIGSFICVLITCILGFRIKKRTSRIQPAPVQPSFPPQSRSMFV